jgi:hypothetical protein
MHGAGGIVDLAGKASVYLPMIDLLHSYFEISSEADTRKRREKVNG